MLVIHEIEAAAHEAYMGNALWGIMQYASMGKSTFPTWGEAFPERRMEEEDKRTAEEIRGDVLRKLRG